MHFFVPTGVFSFRLRNTMLILASFSGAAVFYFTVVVYPALRVNVIPFVNRTLE